MVTRAYIQTIRESASFWGAPYDQANGVASLQAYLQAGLPDWAADPDDLLSRAVPLMVEWNRLASEAEHQQIRRALLPYAEGDDLDVLGLGPPTVLRNPGEQDDDYRPRIANSRRGLNIGSLRSVAQFARAGLSTLDDVFPVIAPNRQDIAVWGLKADMAQLSAADQTQLLEYLRDEDAGRLIGGVMVTAPAPTIVAYTISVSVRYDASRENTQQLRAAVRAAIYAWLDDNQRIGQPVYRSAINESAFIAGVQQIVVLSPTHDLAPPELVISGGDPAIAARAVIRVAPATGAINPLDLLDHGGGYTAVPTVALLDNTNLEGSGASFTATLGSGLAAGQVASIAIDDGGTDYLPGPQHDYCPLYMCPATEAGVMIEMVAI